MPSESHEVFDAVERVGMFSPNGMMTQEGHALVRQLNAMLPLVKEILSAIRDTTVKTEALNWSKEVDSRRSTYVTSIQPDAPSLLKRAESLAQSVGLWAKSGFKVADENVFDKRMAICKACPEWDKDGMGGTGRCRKCGCSTQAKLRMASEKCPIDKW